MNESAITVRYAKALFQVGEETGTLDVLRSNIDELMITIKESAEFSTLLISPIIKSSEKVRVFKTIYSSHFDAALINFFELITKNKREQHLPEMCLKFIQLHKDKKEIKEAVITTAQPLEAKYRDEIHQFLTKKFKLKIELSEEVNPALIGGFRLRIDDQQIDASISTKLRKIQTELINA